MFYLVDHGLFYLSLGEKQLAQDDFASETQRSNKIAQALYVIMPLM